MHGGAILAKENHDLWAAHDRQKQKRTRSARQIYHEEGLSIQEARELISKPNQASEGQSAILSEPDPRASQPIFRAPPKCSGCGMIGHKINRCPA